jgi:hypothetical protein
MLGISNDRARCQRTRSPASRVQLDSPRRRTAPPRNGSDLVAHGRSAYKLRVRVIMRVLVIGGTGSSSKRVTQKALERGHDVRVDSICFDPERAEDPVALFGAAPLG